MPFNPRTGMPFNPMIHKSSDGKNGNIRSMLTLHLNHQCAKTRQNYHIIFNFLNDDETRPTINGNEDRIEDIENEMDEAAGDGTSECCCQTNCFVSKRNYL